MLNPLSKNAGFATDYMLVDVFDYRIYLFFSFMGMFIFQTIGGTITGRVGDKIVGGS